ncbi:spindle and kinetochore-associated protein 2-like [Dreissena polymorpha]|uniref:Protein FAM33A n=1 Tax=Dreissena polymorpha TaxID=45954 RepID=A0A9D4NB60_DREPO|nr:spindle and kinetochore-associated protein 2-like [Dreissena polymorpha]KAH3891411.1 hypothetical protein DPMN_015511 [Dreissena polymorpha]
MQMENAVNILEALFQKADSEVNSLSQKLKLEFENADLAVNPVEIRSKLDDTKKEYETLVKLAAEIQEAQKDAMLEFRGHLNDICQLLLTLQTKTGDLPSEKPEELCRLESFLGTTIPWGSRPTLADDPGPRATPSTSQESDKSPDTLNCSGNTELSSYSTELSPSPQCRESGEFVEVSQEEFESVSSLVRGRVKLAEVNTAYRTLWNHFKEDVKCKTLTPEAMYKLGLRVTGATGQAKLKVLRSLKLIVLTPKGDVSIV